MILKFRTMKEEAEKDGVPQLAEKEDSRLTPFGGWLRKHHLDELPQLWNVLRGDMAFIGPRPILTYHPCKYEEYSDEEKTVFTVRPGISGWAQVNGRNNISWKKKFEYDVYYVDHIGPMMDIKVFFTTIKKVLMRADINTTTGQAATMDYFDGTN